MNDKQTPARETAAPRSRRWFQYRRTWLATALLTFVSWFITPSRYSSGGISFTAHHTGSPGVITFAVRDSHSQPLRGVTVMSESFSGTTRDFVTDASGIATISPGESEVLAVFIEDQGFRLTMPGIFEHFAPDCSRGLTFNVTIRNG